ncbi:MAG TPA: TIGR03435 family protein [Granulicella sp.]
MTQSTWKHPERLLALAVLCCTSLLPVAAGQTASDSATVPKFDVASVKLNNGGGDGRSHIYSSSTSGNFRTANVSLKGLLQFAFGLPETQILNVTGPAASQTFDIDAKVDDATEEQMHKLSSDEGKLRKQQMVQALLAERFKLVSHSETRELPIYVLMVAKGGSKLQETKSTGLKVSQWYGRLEVQGVTTEGLARELAKAVGRVVVDKTGIPGRFDVTLRWTPDQGPAKLNGEPIPDPPPSIFTAIQEQWGLKLDSQKGPVQVLVVDHVETPTAN